MKHINFSPTLTYYQRNEQVYRKSLILYFCQIHVSINSLSIILLVHSKYYSFAISIVDKMNVEILQSSRGNPKLSVNGYLYWKQRVLKSGRISWRCDRRATKCTGLLTTTAEKTNPEAQNQHNHDPNPAEIQALKARNNIKDVARNTDVKPATIVNTQRANAPEDARPLIGKDINREHPLSRWFPQRGGAQHPLGPSKSWGG